MAQNISYTGEQVISTGPHDRKAANYLQKTNLNVGGDQLAQQYKAGSVYNKFRLDQQQQGDASALPGGDQYSDLHYPPEYKQQIFEKQIQNIQQKFMQTKGFQLYQKELFWSENGNKELEELVVNSEHLNPLLKALEDENKTLKNEIRHLTGDVNNFIGMVEVLLNENKQIREHIQHKDRDIAKLIETVSLNDAEEINDLNHKIHVLTEENNILIKHLDEMKRFRQEYDDLARQSEEDMQRARQLHQKLTEDLKYSKNNNQELSKQIKVLEPLYKTAQEKNIQYEDEVEELSNQLNQSKLEITKLQKDVEYYKNQYEDVSRTKGQENDQLLQVKHDLQYQNKQLTLKLTTREKALEELDAENKRQKRQYDDLRVQFEQVAQQIGDVQSQIQLEKGRVDASIAREKQMQEQYGLALNEAEKANNKLQQLEKQYNQLLESSKLELQDKHNKYERIIETLKIKQREQLSEKDDELQLLQKTLADQKRMIERFQSDNEIKSRDLGDLKTRLSDYQQQKRIIDAQTLELRQQQNEVAELQNLLNEYKQQLNATSDQRQVDELSAQVRQWQDKYVQLQSDYNNPNLRDDNERLQYELQEQVSQVDYQRRQIEELKSEVERLREENQRIVAVSIDQRLSNNPLALQEHERFSQSQQRLRDLMQENKRLEDANNLLQAELIKSGQKPIYGASGNIGAPFVRQYGGNSSQDSAQLQASPPGNTGAYGGSSRTAGQPNTQKYTNTSAQAVPVNALSPLQVQPGIQATSDSKPPGAGMLRFLQQQNKDKIQ